MTFHCVASCGDPTSPFDGHTSLGIRTYGIFDVTTNPYARYLSRPVTFNCITGRLIYFFVSFQVRVKKETELKAIEKCHKGKCAGYQNKMASKLFFIKLHFMRKIIKGRVANTTKETKIASWWVRLKC